jgi:hypothetical protein
MYLTLLFCSALHANWFSYLTFCNDKHASVIDFSNFNKPRLTHNVNCSRLNNCLMWMVVDRREMIVHKEELSLFQGSVLYKLSIKIYKCETVIWINQFDYSITRLASVVNKCENQWSTQFTDTPVLNEAPRPETGNGGINPLILILIVHGGDLSRLNQQVQFGCRTDLSARHVPKTR